MVFRMQVIQTLAYLLGIGLIGAGVWLAAVTIDDWNRE